VSENSDGRYDITGALSDEKSLIIYKYLKNEDARYLVL